MFVVAQRDDVDEVTADGLYTFGVVATLGSVQRGMNGVRVVIEGHERGIAMRVAQHDGYLQATVSDAAELQPLDPKGQDLLANVYFRLGMYPRAIEIFCRPSAIRRVIANLIDNAVRYGRLVEVRIVRQPGLIAVVVDDDGPGIPVNQQEKVFAPFYRLDPSRDPAKGGVGLGLSVARTIAREHGGDVTLCNRASGGLGARVELPG